MALSKKTVLAVVAVIIVAYFAISFYGRYVAYPATREKQENIQQDVESKIQNMNNAVNAPRIIDAISASEGDNKMTLSLRNTGGTDINGNTFKVSVEGKTATSTGCNTVLKPLEFCKLKLEDVGFPARGEKRKIVLTYGDITEERFCIVDTSPVYSGRFC